MTVPSALDYYKKPNGVSFENGRRITYSANSNNQQYFEQRTTRLWRIFIFFMLFACTSLYKLNQEEFIINSFLSFVDTLHDLADENNNTNATLIAPLSEREWDRMLFGIFTYDSPNEAEIRSANRETHLSYFRYFHEKDQPRPDLICNLRELMNNATLARDPESCRVVYTFVMGGGGSGDENLRRKVSILEGGRNAKFDVKTRCLWQDPECGGKEIAKWTLDTPICNISIVFSNELESHDDITLLSIPENHELGKTDTWFTYAAMLTQRHPELQIGFVGKLDSDNFVRWPVFFRYLQTHKQEMHTKPFIYGGYLIHKLVCSGKVYNRACKSPRVIFEVFASGAMAYLSTPLVQHVFMDGTTLARKNEVWMVGEDMQLGNMVYSNPNITPYLINHRYGSLGNYINTHCFNNATLYRRDYYWVYPEQKKLMEAAVQSGSLNATK